MPEKRFILTHQDGGFFNINDGSHWIRVSDPMAATPLTQTKATNILKNMIKPKERSAWSIGPAQELDEPPAHVPVPKPQQKEEKKPLKEENFYLNEWLAKAEEFKHYYEDLLTRKEELIERLRLVSAELVDIEHYVELTSLNAAGGYQAYRMLKERLLTRRRIKDDLLCISIFLKAEPRNILNGNLTRQLAGLGTRAYGPRVLSDLFAEDK